ncbi:hypothetical protein [Dyadobacter fermentans]|uniref:Outer membrane protein beta-barrel domain-containing protein n=1 Tax=Dyadobacter fermentans (strain ATCC 700827 / DSM 18053 / CIP 107007 / KCTC 52180 / NS114) TaxID=471854 RepID=C6VUY2_DYAFD|nr:hypothetical protein [Dyadobacter fermentans]ACT93119.1 hypothetical protein Dfer_1885 [Dyadobacter fermentans DSM 18053]
MRKILIIFVCLFIVKSSFGQSIQSIPVQFFSSNIGLAKLGTGDSYGLMVGMEYERIFQQKFLWSTELATTIHDGADILKVKPDNLPEQDLSYRYTIAAVQVVGKVGHYFLRTNKFEIGGKVGALARFQSSSLADDREVLFPALTGYPLPLRINRNTEPQRTVSVGGTLQIFARHNFKNNWAIGTTTGLQLDTNGDVIFPQFLLSIGKRL